MSVALTACTDGPPDDSPTIHPSQSVSPPEAGAVFLMTSDTARAAEPTCSTQGPITIGFEVAIRADGRRELVGHYLDEPGEPEVPPIEWPKGFTSDPGPPLRVLSNDGVVVAIEGESAVVIGASVGAGGIFSPCIINGTYYPEGLKACFTACLSAKTLTLRGGEMPITHRIGMLS